MPEWELASITSDSVMTISLKADASNLRANIRNDDADGFNGIQTYCWDTGAGSATEAATSLALHAVIRR